MNIAEQMGTVLQQTASSVNIKERVDFSCAVFSKRGELIANAPHMPVHLGSMQQSVQSIIKNNKNAIHEGDSFALNAPYNGGTHLPDITIVTPVFIENKLTFFVASRPRHRFLRRVRALHGAGSPRLDSASLLQPVGTALWRQRLDHDARQCQGRARGFLCERSTSAREWTRRRRFESPTPPKVPGSLFVRKPQSFLGGSARLALTLG